MDKSETADLLAFCAGYDKRKIGSADVNAWTLALSAVEEDDAREAVILFYREMHTDDRGRDRPVGTGDIMHILRLRNAKAPPPQLARPEAPPPGVAVHGKAQVAAAAAQARQDNKDRRTRVLRYPDLAARLTQPPLNYPKAGMWNGFVPPKRDPRVDPDLLHSPGINAPGHPNQRRRRALGSGLNGSERRAALVSIATEALARDQEQKPADDW